MSNRLSVYAVNVDKLAAVIGSGDRQLEAKIAGWAVRWFADIDELADRDEDDDDDDDDEEPTPTCLEVLSRLIEGVDPNAVPVLHRYVYGYVFQALCGFLGEELDAISSIAQSSKWIDSIDQYLAEIEIPVKFADLIYSGCPVPIPEPDDYPMIGRLSPEVIAQGLEPLRSVVLAHPNDDPESTVLQLRQWFEHASARPGSSLVGFLS
jgi:hypothetical protein